LRTGPGGAILALGAPVAAAMEAAALLDAEGLALTVASARFAKPVDAACLERLLAEHPWVLTVEDHAAAGGFGSAVLETAESRGLDSRRIHRLGVADVFVEHDTRAAQTAAAGIDARGLAARARALADTAPR
ncbi:MAG: 1-deoxy-D-xylulose-5-phosphate synthase, partial [Planctomycetes bacterium]|nr:1-deoxy-D-xylulose-5-phosphate synthase [Planctomycetota bacterium]